MTWAKGWSEADMPKTCACLFDVSSPASYLTVSSGCQKCYGTTYNLADWDITRVINRDTYRSLITETSMYEEPLSYAVRYDVRLHGGETFSCMVSKAAYSLAYDEVFEHTLIDGLRSYAPKISVASRRALYRCVRKIYDEQMYAAKENWEKAYFNKYYSLPQKLSPEAIAEFKAKITDYIVPNDSYLGLGSAYAANSAATVVPRDLSKLIPGLKDAAAVPCPACGAFHRLLSAVPHLNDEHEWTREAIADWLETLDVDLSFATPDTIPA